MTTSADTAAFLALPTETQVRGLTLVARAALKLWGAVEQDPQLLKHRENAVFKVTAPNGGPAVLRVHRQGYHTDASLRSELAWMHALREGGVVAPEPIATAAGAYLAKVESDGAPGIWQVDMLDWLDGRQLGEIGEPLDLPPARRTRVFAALGECAAHLHDVSLRWQLPDGFERHGWNLQGLVGEQPLWGRFWELAALQPTQAQLLLRAREKARRLLSLHGRTSDNYGLIHADLLPENVLVAGDTLQLIDFDDAGFGWHMFEIATALFWFRNEADFSELAAALVRGYRGRRPLPDREIDALPLFTMLRGFTYLGWVHTRRGTAVAQELTPMMVEIVCQLADEFLAST